MSNSRDVENYVQLVAYMDRRDPRQIKLAADFLSRLHALACDQHRELCGPLADDDVLDALPDDMLP